MNVSPISIRNKNGEFGGWIDARCMFSADQAVSTFQMTASEKWATESQNENWQLPTQSEVQIFIHGQLALTGKIIRHESRISRSSGSTDHLVTVSGESTTGSLLRSSIESDTHRWQGSPDEIIRGICKNFNINVNAIRDNIEAINYQTTQFMSPFEAIVDLGNRYGFLPQPAPDGGLRLSLSDDDRANVVEIDTFIDCSMTSDISQKFSKLSVVGQGFSIDSPDNIYETSQATVTDDSYYGYAPKTIPIKGNASKAQVDKKAQTARARAIKDSLNVTVNVSKLLDSNGQIWRPLQRVWFRSERQNINTELTISDVELSYSRNEGTKARLVMTHPDSYLPFKSKSAQYARQNVSSVNNPGLYFKDLDFAKTVINILSGVF